MSQATKRRARVKPALPAVDDETEARIARPPRERATEAPTVLAQKGRKDQVTITMANDFRLRLDAAAKSLGLSRTAFMTLAAAEKLIQMGY